MLFDKKKLIIVGVVLLLILAIGGYMMMHKGTIATSTSAPSAMPTTMPVNSGNYYILFLKNGLYLNSDTLALVDQSDASVFYWDNESNILYNSDNSKLLMEGVQVQATPGVNGIALGVYGHVTTLFPGITGTDTRLGPDTVIDTPAGVQNNSDYLFAFVPA